MTSTFPGGSETVFTYGAPLLKFGTGASDEIGYDLSQYGARRVLVVTDARIAATGLPARVADQMKRFDIEAHVYMASTSSRPTPAGDRPRHRARSVGRLCGRGRRLQHRHRQGGPPAHHQPIPVIESLQELRAPAAACLSSAKLEAHYADNEENAPHSPLRANVVEESLSTSESLATPRRARGSNCWWV
jgi:hypothetical protein